MHGAMTRTDGGNMQQSNGNGRGLEDEDDRMQQYQMRLRWKARQHEIAEEEGGNNNKNMGQLNGPRKKKEDTISAEEGRDMISTEERRGRIRGRWCGTRKMVQHPPRRSVRNLGSAVYLLPKWYL